jgi:hypothetical protein
MRSLSGSDASSGRTIMSVMEDLRKSERPLASAGAIMNAGL